MKRREFSIATLGAAAGSLGLPDLGISTMDDVMTDVRRITDATDVPLLVDIDTGFGGAFNIARTVKSMIKMGAAAVHIEDQVQAKRCGHRPNKAVVSQQEMVDRVKAAVDAKTDPDFVIMARTDALAVEGFEAAMERAEAYLACGVDALFIEALRTPEQMALACERFAGRIPLLANMVEGGKTPVQSAAELGERGFKIVIFPGGTTRAVLHTLQGYYASLHTHQTTRPWQEKMLDFDGLNAVIETPQLLALGQRYEAGETP